MWGDSMKMRRPAAAVMISFAGGIFTARYCDSLIVFSAFGLILLVLFITQCRQKAIYLQLVLFVFGAMDFILIDSRNSPLSEFTGNLAVIEGHVQSVEEKPYGYQMVVSGTSFEFDGYSGRLKEKFLLNASGNMDMIEGIPLQNSQSIVGRNVSFLGRVEAPPGQRNPGLFDYRFYLKTKGIEYILCGSLRHMTIKGISNPFSANMARIKYRFSQALDKSMDSESKSLLLGMLFGDKTSLSEDVYDIFRKNGTAHILAVSGIHVGVVYALVNRLFRNKRSIFSSAVTIILLLFYAALASFSPSVMRAFTMIVIHILSKHFHKRYDLLSSTAFSAFLMLLLHPYSLFQLGFQLSYLAVFSLAFVLPFTESRLGMLCFRHNPLKNAVLGILISTVSLQLTLIPITAFNFQYISLSAFLINIPVIVLAGFIIPLGILLLIVGFGGGELFSFLSAATEILLKAMKVLNGLVGECSFSSFNVVSPDKAVVIAFYTLIFFLTSECFWDFYRRRRLKHTAVVILSLLALSTLLSITSGGNGLRADIVFVDVGQGDCIHIRTPSGKNILVDGGGSLDYDVGKKILLPYLLKNGVARIDLALVTHLHTDHFGGISSLCRLMPVKRLALYSFNRCKQDDILSETGLTSEALLYLSKGHTIKVDDDVALEILYPPSPGKDFPIEGSNDEDDENARSLLIRVHISGLSVLITGDMGVKEEQAAIALYGTDSPQLKSDILKVGHHGSASSTGNGFVLAVNPCIAVIQSGKNNFGHPHPKIIEKLDKAGIMLYRTDQNGAVLLRIREQKILVHAMLQ